MGGETTDYDTNTSEVRVYDPELDAWSRTTPFVAEQSSLLGGVIGNSIFVTSGSGRTLKTVRGMLVEK